MQVREVITVFLEHDGQVLIVRRSDQVGSYRGHWSGISGYLEGDPLTHAYTEVREETGLAATDLTLLRQAPPLEIADAVKATVWRVHPFLFAVREPDKIRLDWENVGLQWIRPTELVHFQTVPALAETLAACLGLTNLEGRPEGP